MPAHSPAGASAKPIHTLVLFISVNTQTSCHPTHANYLCHTVQTCYIKAPTQIIFMIAGAGSG